MSPITAYMYCVFSNVVTRVGDVPSQTNNNYNMSDKSTECPFTKYNCVPNYEAWEAFEGKLFAHGGTSDSIARSSRPLAARA